MLDELDARERAAFEADCRADPQLAALVRELEAALERRVRALPQHEPPAGLLSRIESRLSGSERPGSATPHWATVVRWGLAAVIAISVATLAIQSLRRPAPAPGPVVVVVGLDSNRSSFAVLPLREHPANADAGFVQLASLAENYWEKPDQLPLKPAADAPSGRGYAVFDPASHQGFIAIQQLPAIEPGKRCCLWLLDTGSGEVREIGALPGSGAARGLYSFAVESGTGANPERLDFFVTAEDNAAATRPSGRVVLGDRRM